MSSNVGSATVYEGKDQVTRSDAEIQKEQQEKRFKEGKENSHNQLDSKDERSIANKLERESSRDDDGSGKKKTEEQKLGEIDPTAPAKAHGNEPSKGAKIDKQLQDEEEEYLRRKGKA